MRKLTTLTALFVFLCASASAALPPLVQWNVQTGTSLTIGSNANGGGFVSGGTGTDYSKQAAAQFSGTTLASTNGTTGGGCTITASTHNFVATDVDNIIQISAGTNWTTGFYRVVSAAANAATLDRACGSSATLSSGTWALGGALATLAQAYSACQSGAATPSAPTVWVNGTSTITTTLTPDGAACPAITTQGYSATYGDSGRAIITTATNSTRLISFAGSNGWATFRQIDFTTSAGTPTNLIYASTSNIYYSLLIDNCTLTGGTIQILGDFNTDYYFHHLTILNSHLTGASSDGIRNGGNTYIIGSKIDSEGGYANNQQSQITPQVVMCIDSVIQGNTAGGINMPQGTGGASISWGCNYYNNTTTGWSMATRQAILMYNNMFDSNTTAGIGGGSNTISTNGTVAHGYSGYRNNGGGNTPTVLPAGVSDPTVSVSPWVTPGTDYTLNTTVGGGAALKGAGFPGTVPSSGTGARSIGALEPVASAGGAINSAYSQ